MASSSAASSPRAAASTTLSSDGMRRKPSVFTTSVHERNVAAAKLVLDSAFPFPYAPAWFADLLRQAPPPMLASLDLRYPPLAAPSGVFSDSVIPSFPLHTHALYRPPEHARAHSLL